MKLIEFEDILQFVNQLAGKMDLQAIVIRAEDLYYRFSYLCQFIDDEDLHAISSSES